MKKYRKKLYYGGFVFIALLALALFLPGQTNAGELEPPGAPGPTMKTLDEIPPTWSQKIPGAERFVEVLDGAGVLDKETGLVWEKSPPMINYTWTDAIIHCYQLELGGRMGWHLPTIEQLASLADSSAIGAPKLPSGHPFDKDCTDSFCVSATDPYWSATTTAYNSIGAWVFFFTNNTVISGDKVGDVVYAWCVRGGLSHDAY